MMMRKNEIENVLKDLYYSAYSQNINLTEGMVYNYLKKLNIRNNLNNNKVHENLFSKWIDRFSSVDNIKVFNDMYWPYFCQFVNGFVPFNCIKMYVPLDYDHLYEGANRIFDFMAKNNISHTSKIGSVVRSDDLVIRVGNREDVEKIQNFINSDSYIKEGLMPHNPFVFDIDSVGYAYDGTLSYNSCIAAVIASYINYMKSMEDGIDYITIDSFIDYINLFERDNDKLSSISYVSSSPNGVSYAKLVNELLKISLKSSDKKDFYGFFDYCSSIDINAMEEKNNKEELFKELVLVTMKKYYRGYDKENPEISGYDYIRLFLRGNIMGVTRTNNMRERVRGNLSSNDVLEMVTNSDIIGNDCEDRTYNYIKVIMLNDIIKNMDIRFPNMGLTAINRFIETGNFKCLTNSVGEARKLAFSLNAKEMKELFVKLDVKNIFEYADKYYYNNVKGKEIIR